PYVPAILFVICPELLAQRRLFIQDDKQMHAERNGCHRGDRYRIGVSENDPQPDPSDCEASSRNTSCTAYPSATLAVAPQCTIMVSNDAMATSTGVRHS